MRGLVLAGGGAKGAYQIGVWKALRELGVDIDVVCGTSIGAFNGAFVAQQQFDKAYKLWSNMTMNDLFEADDKLIQAFEHIVKEKKLPTNLSIIKDFFYYIRRSGGIDITPLRRMISTYLDEELLRASPIKYGLVTVNLTKMKPLRLFTEDIPVGKLNHYLLGSAMVPGFARRIDDPIRFVDGGVYDNFPIKMAIEKGCTEVVAVSLGSIKRREYPDVNVVYIEPKRELGNFLHVEKERIHSNIRMGYLDGLRAFYKLEGDMFYFKNLYSEQDVINRLSLMDFEVKNEITRILFDKNLEHERYFFEKVLPKVFKMLNCNSKDGYKELMLKLYEKLLAHNNEDYLVVYSPVMVKNRLEKIDLKGEDRVLKLLLDI